MIRAYFGHHKCASQYIKAVFLQTTALLGMVPALSDSWSEELPLGYHTREPYVTLLTQHRNHLHSEEYASLCLTNGDTQAVKVLEKRGNYRGFHVIRDPRDVLVSAYFSHRYSHPIRSDNDNGWIAVFREQLQSVETVEAGLLMELEFNADNFRRMEYWDYANPNVYETTYERIITDPLNEFTCIFNFLGIATPGIGLPTLGALVLDRLRQQRTGRAMPLRTALPRLLLQRIVQRNAFERKTDGRTPGVENTQHHYRKGIAGDWRNYFTPRVTEAFKERYGALVIQLGYEASSNW
jgi:hypothetical protein